MKQFKRIYIEITNVCNLDCEFCPKTSRKPGFMGVDLFKKVLDEIEGHTKHLYFHVMGEPLLHPEIGLFLDLCGERGFKVNITTNGTLIKEAKNKLLSKIALHTIFFSLHIFDATTPRGDIDNYLDELFLFISEAGYTSDFGSCFRFWNLKHGEIENKRVHNVGANAYILERIEKFFKIPFKIAETNMDGKGITLADKIYLNKDSKFDWPNREAEDLGEYGFCLAPKQQIGILADGTVVPCCLDNEGTIELGNISKSSFKDIIMGSRLTALRCGFLKRRVVEPLCRKCGYKKRFDKLYQY